MSPSACSVAIEVDGRQRFVFESDKLREMLGASRLIADTVQEAERLFSGSGLRLMQPVSGDIRAWAPFANKTLLLEATWKLREWLDERGIAHTCAYLETDESHFLTTHSDPAEASPIPTPLTEPGFPSLSWVHRSLGRLASEAKQSKRGPDARPACALFANCQIHPGDTANIWRAGDREDVQDGRRDLVSDRADLKRRAWDDHKGSFYQNFLAAPVWESVRTLLPDRAGDVNVARPIVFNDLADALDTARGGSYIAFVCADGDGMGRLIAAVNWNTKEWTGDEPKPWERNRAFSMALDQLVKQSFTNAMVGLTVGETEANALARQDDPELNLPLLLLLLGGDDLWAVTRRDVALPLAVAVSAWYRKLLNDTTASAFAPVRAAATAAAVPLDALTISFGVAFAKAGYPVSAMVSSAEQLLKQAKSLRKGLLTGRTAATDGCVDWHWIQSSVNETVADARRLGWTYADSSAEMRLTTRPWTAPQSALFATAAQVLAGGVPRRKREQLEGILRRGLAPSRLAWEGWWKSLTPDEQTVVDKVRAHLEGAGCALESNAPASPDAAASPACPIVPWWPWAQQADNVYVTPFLDLLSLNDTLGQEHGGQR